MNIDVVILAAGQGTRMRSDLPKVMHQLAGKSLIQHVLDTANQLESSHIHLVVGHGAEQVKQSVDSRVNCVIQSEQLGTGHAVQQTLPYLRQDSIVLILYGDVPLIHISTLNKMLSLVNEQQIGLLTVELDAPSGYGRIIRSGEGLVSAIVEQKDAKDEQLAIKEINTGILAVKSSHLRQWLPGLSNNNAQGEYYLTDVIALAAQNNIKIETVQPGQEQEVQGVNSRVQLAELERWYQQRQAVVLMEQGASLLDPGRFDLRGELEVGQDVVIDVNVIIEGKVKLGDNVRIGANTIIINSVIGNNVDIQANSILDQTEVSDGCSIGPFARLRPGTKLAEKAKVGNFVETKKTHIGRGSKVNHLSYIGDSEIGEAVNIGAGTITCNYDGVNKFKTVIEDGAFIGSNTSLVAPVRIGTKATVGAGSTITREVASNELGIARGKQRNIPDWKRPEKKK